MEQHLMRIESDSAVIFNAPFSAGKHRQMSIAFETDEVQLQKLRERLRGMSDDELINFGKEVRALSEPRVSVTPDPWKAQLEEARAECRRRHPTPGCNATVE